MEKKRMMVADDFGLSSTADNTVYAVRANALTQMLGFASHFVYQQNVRRHFAVNTEKMKKDLKKDISFDSKRKGLLQYEEV
jgi:hypothetical protein